MVYILGYKTVHDSSAVLLKDGYIIGAVEEERFNQTPIKIKYLNYLNLKKRFINCLSFNIMVKLIKIVNFLNEYLKINEIEDGSWNGLQIEGKPDVKKIVLAVDAGTETFEKSVEAGADMVIVHHGQFWKDANPSIIDWNKKRIDILYKNKMSLYVAHLPLDRHEKVGNNVQLLKLLGARINKEFLDYKGKNISWMGDFKNGIKMENIVKKLNSELNTKCTVLAFGKKIVKTIGVCSGGGDYKQFFEALNKKLDLYLTGDINEVYHAVKDAGINVIFAGHHATETVGLKALSKVINKKFKVETIFIELPTGL